MEDSAIVRLDAQIRTDRAIRDLQTRRVITPQAQATPQADVPEVTVQIPDDRLADSNARAKAELGWRPAYPTYREGVQALLAVQAA